METKKPWLSKTLWINFIIAGLTLGAPQAQAYVAAHPDIVTVGFTLINIILRLVTKEKLSLND